MLTLRPFQPEDQERILEILTDKTVSLNYMLPDFQRKEDAIPLFNRLMTLSQDKNRFIRCICRDSQAIGFLNDVELENKGIELGYVIHPDSQGRGFMTQALKLAIAELFALGYERVICGAFERNRASLRVMEKAGMKKVARMDTIEYRGENHLCMYYSAEKE